MLKNNRIIFKLIIIIVLILSAQLMINSFSYAGLAEHARHEGASRPASQPDDDEPTTTETEEEEEEEERETNLITPTIFTSIEGTVYEDNANNLNIDNDPSNPFTADDELSTVPGVVVSLGSTANTVTTDSEGKFKFEPAPGNYFISFECANVEKSKTLDSSLKIADILKYNGQDYIVDKISGSVGDIAYDTLNVTEHEIIQSKRGATQVYLLIDMSVSMFEGTTVINGTEKNKLDASIDAAKVLIHGLLSEGKNIYIGIIVYAGDCYRAASLTKDELYLYDKLEEAKKIYDEMKYGYTDFTVALDKAYNSFYINESDPDFLEHTNRSIVLITDGVPTKAGLDSFYDDDSEEYIHDLLINKVGPATKNKLEEIKNAGVHIMSLISPETDSETVSYIESIFKDIVDVYAMASDDQDLINRIKKDVKEFIIRTVEVGNTEYTSDFQEFFGYEDSVRRRQITKNFENTFFFNHLDTENTNNGSARLKLFKNIEDDPNINEITEDISKLSELTYMTLDFPESIKIDNLEDYKQKKISEIDSLKRATYGEGNYQLVTEDKGNILVISAVVNRPYDVDGNGVIDDDESQNWVKEDMEPYKIVITTAPYVVDIHLCRNQTGALQTKVTATAMKILLNEGTTLSFKERELDDQRPLLEVLDDDVAQGATIQIEYTIEVCNNSGMQFNYLQLVDYFPKDFLFSPDTELLTERGTNAKYGWSEIEIDKDPNDPTKHTLFGDGYISNESLEKYKDHRTAVILTKSNDGQGAGGFFIPAGYSNESYSRFKLVVTRVISSAYDLTSDMSNDVEVLSYNNQAARRTTLPLFDHVKTFLGIYPGDSKVYTEYAGELSKFLTRNYSTGVDYSQNSNDVLIVPPTGGDSTPEVYMGSLISSVIVPGLDNMFKNR